MPDQHRSARYVGYVILLLWLTNVFNYMDRMALAVLLPSIKADLALSDGQLGLLVGLAFSIFYAICGIPIARWADRGIRRNIIAIAVATWSVMTALSGAAQNFLHLFLARIGVGAGEAGSMAPGASLLCDYVPLKRRSGALAILAFGSFTGIWAGMAFAGWLGEAVGWRWAFVVLGLPGIALALAVRFTLREPTRGFFDAQKNETAALSLAATLAVLWRCRTYRMIALFLVANGFVQYGLNQWWPSFYVRMFPLEASSIGPYLGLAIGAGGAAGVLIGGWMANKAGQRDVRLPLRICAALAVLALPTAMASLFVPSLAGSLTLVLMTGMLWGVSNGPVLAAQYSIVTSRMRATAGATAVFVTSVLGFGLGPLCVGVLSDALAPALGVQSLRYALVVPVCVGAVMAIALFAAARTLPADLQAMGHEADQGSHGDLVSTSLTTHPESAARAVRETA